jgi:hypothetical protein
LVLFATVTHSFVYAPVLISATVIALLLRLFGRSSKPLCDSRKY